MHIEVLYCMFKMFFFIIFLTLFLVGLFPALILMGGGAQSAPPIFIFENTRKSNKIMHCVEKKSI